MDLYDHVVANPAAMVRVTSLDQAVNASLAWPSTLPGLWHQHPPRAT